MFLFVMEEKFTLDTVWKISVYTSAHVVDSLNNPPLSTLLVYSQEIWIVEDLILADNLSIF